jgi:uracil phosphoribosyltransferase
VTPDRLTVVRHPLVQHKLALMRDQHTPTATFRLLLREIAMLLCYEATRDLPVERRTVRTPVAETEVEHLEGKKLVLASILRAGNGLLEGMLDLVPSARVAHVGLYRDPTTLRPVEYYFKAPDDLSGRRVVVVDPMLATGNSAVAAVELLKARGALDLRFVCLLAAPEGVETLQRAHPDLEIVTAAIDEGLNAQGYIVPGLGDAGDRMYGTK